MRGDSQEIHLDTASNIRAIHALPCPSFFPDFQIILQCLSFTHFNLEPYAKGILGSVVYSSSSELRRKP